MSLLPREEVVSNPGKAPDAAVIWLHGLGADGHDFVPLVPHLQLPDSLSVRFVFPHAPELAVTVNGGYFMPAWYDILEMGQGRKINQAQLMDSVAATRALVQREIARGIPAERIVIAGFSQGGAVACHAALAFPDRLAGLLMMSTYFPVPDMACLAAANVQLPVRMMHGEQDSVVPIALGIEARRELAGRGLKPEFTSYPMDHEVCLEEIADISRWLQQVLG